MDGHSTFHRGHVFRFDVDQSSARTCARRSVEQNALEGHSFAGKEFGKLHG
jgi:hypothetical protein